MGGHVYALTNQGMPGLIKIGHTTNTPEHRAAQLNTTGLPYPFKVLHSIEAQDSAAVERKIHQLFRPYRVQKGREFFKISEQQAIEMLNEHTDNELIKAAERRTEMRKAADDHFNRFEQLKKLRQQQADAKAQQEAKKAAYWPGVKRDIKAFFVETVILIAPYALLSAVAFIL